MIETFELVEVFTVLSVFLMKILVYDLKTI